ncbi:uncharacterized protein LOC110979972 [Acanthaster planci]|uniref:Uncharacterized protein LOC110979972 n=1 Tax=Acanthaster planci TaxID=133434 RepID=A0A8B7YH26_ACAPL|nr:uncharacterized protein LOC110979972 [Acanthaster planci]
MAGKIKVAESSGSDVVLACIQSFGGIFPSDHGFLRRVAWVESKDGTDPNTYRAGYHGGIWQVDKIGFESTKDTASHPGLRNKFASIKSSLSIDWTTVQWDDLRKPLYSALAARLFLANIPSPIPSGLQEQAAYWKNHYNTSSGAGSESKFVNDVKTLENK